MKIYSPTIDQDGNPGSQPSPWRPGGIEAHGWDTLPFLPGDPEGEEFTASLKQQAWDKAVEDGAEDVLLYRAKLRRADELERERSGSADPWAPIDIGDSWDREQQLPDVGSWSDGLGIFYSGKVNEVHGPSESGKTMFLLAVAAQEIRLGHHVIMVDYEDDPDAVTARMRWVFGLERGEVEKYFHYFNPGRALTDEAFTRLTEIGATLGIIDAVTEAMSCSGLNGREENEVAAWYAEFPKRIAATGVAVALVDHTSKTNHEEALGSQHKKSAITGVSYTAKPVAPFTKGHRGELSIRVAKDKLGGVRPHADMSADGQPKRGSLVIDGTQGQAEVILGGVEPDRSEPTAEPEAAPLTLPDVSGIQRPYLKSMNFYEKDGTSPSELSSYMKDRGYDTTAQLARTKLIELKRKGLVVQPEPKGRWFITPLGVSVIAAEIALVGSWSRPKRTRKGPGEHDQMVPGTELSEELSRGSAKAPFESSESSAKALAKVSLTCDESYTPESESSTEST